VHHQQLTQFDFTPEQYTGLVKLTAALSRVFPKIRPVYPHRFLSREPIMEKLSDRRLVRYQGILGHFHIQENKVDPGPAFDWPRFAEEVRAQLNGTTPQLSAPFVRNSDPP
jgi:N-acetyl-anhydromuramyl-L-alanine amidase AmpD